MMGTISERYLDGLMEADILAPFLYYDSLHKTREMEPEKTLMVAVLEDAIDCYRRYSGARDGKGKRMFLEAESWLMENDGDWLFSFANICAVIGLSAGFIRAGLLRRKQQMSSTKRPRERRKESFGAKPRRSVGGPIRARRAAL